LERVSAGTFARAAAVTCSPVPRQSTPPETAAVNSPGESRATAPTADPPLSRDWLARANRIRLPARSRPGDHGPSAENAAHAGQAGSWASTDSREPARRREAGKGVAERTDDECSRGVSRCYSSSLTQGRKSRCGPHGRRAYLAGESIVRTRKPVKTGIHDRIRESVGHTGSDHPFPSAVRRMHTDEPPAIARPTTATATYFSLFDIRSELRQSSLCPSDAQQCRGPGQS
jgi:hypothetical protein